MKFLLTLSSLDIYLSTLTNYNPNLPGKIKKNSENSITIQFLTKASMSRNAVLYVIAEYTSFSLWISRIIVLDIFLRREYCAKRTKAINCIDNFASVLNISSCYHDSLSRISTKETLTEYQVEHNSNTFPPCIPIPLFEDVRWCLTTWSPSKQALRCPFYDRCLCYLFE